jgi:carboxyl-terminal processing protease
LVNEFTYSAAEMVANFAQENALALIVGTKSAGMVLGGRNLAVGGGYWLGLPVFGWFTSRGETIEGKGVVPNIQVDALPQLLMAGRDEQLLAAVEAINIERSRQR